MTPRFHHWHHGIEKEAIDVDFAVHFPMLDRFFGTYFLPKDRWPEGYRIAGDMARSLFKSQSIMKRGVIIAILVVFLCGIHAFCATTPRIASQWPGIPAGAASDLNVIGNTLFANITRNNVVIDISDANEPRRVGTIRMPDYPQVRTAGPYLLEHNNVWIRLVDVSERTSPTEVVRVEGNFTIPLIAWPFLYTLRSGDQRLVIYDFTNPRQPIEIAPQAAVKLAPLQISGDRLLTQDLGLANPARRFLDISNRTNPIRGALASDGFLVMRGNLAFFFRSIGTVKTVDVTDVANPKTVGEAAYRNAGGVLDAEAVGNYVLVTSSDRNHGIEILDMTDQTRPKIVDSIPGGPFSRHVRRGNDLFFADYKGITVYDATDPAGPAFKAEIVINPEYANAQVIGDKVLLHDWYGPARLIEVTNATRPRVVQQLRPSYASLLVGDKLFLRDTEDFVDVYNATDLQHPQELSRLKFNDLWFTMASDGDRLFVSCSNTIKVVNFSNPKAMIVESSITVPGMWNVRLARTGARLVASANYTDSYLSVIDISDATRPTLISTVTNNASFGKLAVNGNSVYVCGASKVLMFEIDEAGRLNERGQLDIGGGVSDVAVSGNKLAALKSEELRLYNVSVPFSPKLVGALINMPVDLASVTILGDYAYVAAGNSGLITVQLAGEPPTQPYLDIINEGEMHRIRWTADFANSFMVTLPELGGTWIFQPTFDDAKMFIEASAPNDGNMQFYELLK